MKSFKNHNFITEAKNMHMTHIEDLILDGGVKGARQAINALRSLRDMLSGNAKAPVDISVKWDGAPALFCGADPRDGKFFVAKKGIFNNDPKVYKSYADIDDDTSGDLNKKLKLAYDNLKDLGITNVIQGDFMFEKSDLKTEKINGVGHLTFHPNTIVYAVPTGTLLAKTIAKAKIGIVWHTSYTGTRFENMKASFGKSIATNLKKTPNVWMVDATYPDISGKAVMSAAETALVTKLLSDAGKTFRKVETPVLKELEDNKELNLVVNVYNNTVVRKGQRITDPKKHAKGLIKFVKERYAKKASKLKSDKGKAGVKNKENQLLTFFSDSNLNILEQVFILHKLVTDAKLIIINKLETLSNIDTFVKTKSGYKVTGPEGFVAIDRTEGGAVKLVDRLEFSTNNFSPDIIKGWDNPG